MGAEIPICPLCHTPRMPKRKGDAWFWGCHNYAACTVTITMTPPVPHEISKLESHLQITMHWIKEVETAESIDELFDIAIYCGANRFP